MFRAVLISSLTEFSLPENLNQLSSLYSLSPSLATGGSLYFKNNVGLSAHIRPPAPPFMLTTFICTSSISSTAAKPFVDPQAAHKHKTAAYGDDSGNAIDAYISSLNSDRTEPLYTFYKRGVNDTAGPTLIRRTVDTAVPTRGWCGVTGVPMLTLGRRADTAMPTGRCGNTQIVIPTKVKRDDASTAPSTVADYNSVLATQQHIIELQHAWLKASDGKHHEERQRLEVQILEAQEKLAGLTGRPWNPEARVYLELVHEEQDHLVKLWDELQEALKRGDAKERARLEPLILESGRKIQNLASNPAMPPFTAQPTQLPIRHTVVPGVEQMSQKELMEKLFFLSWRIGYVSVSGDQREMERIERDLEALAQQLLSQAM